MMHRYGDIVPTDNVSQTYIHAYPPCFFVVVVVVVVIGLRVMFGVHTVFLSPPLPPFFVFFFHLIYKYVHTILDKSSCNLYLRHRWSVASSCIVC
jgi:hypothetical protein